MFLSTLFTVFPRFGHFLQTQMVYDFNLPLPEGRQEVFDKYFNVEAEYMADAGYAEDANKVLLREDTVKLICTDREATIVQFLAMNYFDRFMSREGTGLQVIEDIFGDFIHFRVCCFSLACKMRMASFTYNGFLSEEARQRFNRNKVFDMELATLFGLDWRMESVTAINFVGYFFCRIRYPRFAGQIAFKIIGLSLKDIRVTRFKPSIIAASCFVTAALFHLEGVNYLSFKEQIHCDPKLNRMELNRCTDIIIEVYARDLGGDN